MLGVSVRLAAAPFGVALLAAALSVQPVARAQPLTLDEVLFRASEAMVVYQKALSSLVAEETYLQRVVSKEGDPKKSRRLVSDFLLIQVPQDDMWIGFRDVFEVDGTAVRDRQERLQKLFLEGSSESIGQARRIARESARYNVGEVQRTVNEPTLPLVFLHPLHQHRLYFEKQGQEDVNGTAAWMVLFTEHKRPTLVRAGRNDLFARGRFWIDPATGRVLKTELLLGDLNTNVRSRIVVSYAIDAALGLSVPVRMEEEVDNPRRPSADRIVGEATYARFRRFQVKVDEKLIVPPPS